MLAAQMVPIIGICFNLLIVRACWHANAPAKVDTRSGASVPLHFASAPGRGSAGTGSEGGASKEKAPHRKHSVKSRAQSPLEVRVAQEVACDRPPEMCSRLSSRESDAEAGAAWAQ